ncbi:hypothetical protein M7I_2639 [Glarea lozoyensis 74030]|uniref:SAP domain-containing protein n=1 Tax=Glarea lozoyensis (strain ATCC 74030 / MF5533) TaxID=1104152 RepID=H0EJB5_GLAL7|nr:hypothetical protein M7I_2639 [Glarea lozoyensis 74030]
MTDWTKLKVVDLKAELKKRGLAQTGLKPALVARLASAENEDGEESETTVQGDGAKQDASSATSPDTVSPVLPSADLGAETVQDGSTQGETSQQPLEISDSIQESASVEPHITSKAPETSTEPSATIEQPVQIPQTHQSTLPSVEPQEARDDGQKRKRRSQSPPPAGTESARKRARQDVDMDGVDNSLLELAEPLTQNNNTIDPEEKIGEGEMADFMRPLNESQLKAYLADLATAPGQDPDLDIAGQRYSPAYGLLQDIQAQEVAGIVVVEEEEIEMGEDFIELRIGMTVTEEEIGEEMSDDIERVSAIMDIFL